MVQILKLTSRYMMKLPTPIQQLAMRGKLKSVRFKGIASPGFDCGNPAATRSHQRQRRA